MAKTIYIILLISLLVFAYEPGWIKLETDSDDSTVSINLINSNTDYIEILYQIPGFEIDTLSENQTSFYRISIKDIFASTDSVGLPELPLIINHIAIPECDSFIVTVDYEISKTFHNILIYPVPKFIRDSIGYHYEFAMDTNYYMSQDTLYPSINFNTSIGYIRGQRVLEFTLTPFRYNAYDSILTVHSFISIKINCYGSSSEVCTDAGPMSNICRSFLLNSEHMPAFVAPFHPESTGGSYDTVSSITALFSIDTCDYLIIVADTFWGKSWIDTIGNHRKNLNQFKVLAIPYKAIHDHYSSLGEEWEKLKMCIRDVYDSCYAPSFSDGKLGFVLLIGDANDNIRRTNYLIPEYNPDSTFDSHYGFWMDKAGSDMEYGDIDSCSDNLPDIYVGRFPVGNTTQLRNIVKKTKSYENAIPNSLPPDTAAYFQVLCVSGMCGEGVTYDARDEAKMWSFANQFPIEPVNFTDYYLVSEDKPPTLSWDNVILVDTFSSDTAEARLTGESIVNQINNGRFWVIHYNHGWAGAWGWGQFDKEDIDDISEGVNSFYIVHSCYTGEFWHKDFDCIGEELTNAANKGAIGYIGAARTSTKGDIMIKNMFKNYYSLAGEICAAKYIDKSEYTLLGDPALKIIPSFGLPNLTVGKIKTTSTLFYKGCTLEVSISNLSEVAVESSFVFKTILYSFCDSYVTYDTLPFLGAYPDTAVFFITRNDPHPLYNRFNVEVDIYSDINEWNESDNILDSSYSIMFFPDSFFNLPKLNLCSGDPQDITDYTFCEKLTWIFSSDSIKLTYFDNSTQSYNFHSCSTWSPEKFMGFWFYHDSLSWINSELRINFFNPESIPDTTITFLQGWNLFGPWDIPIPSSYFHSDTHLNLTIWDWDRINSKYIRADNYLEPSRGYWLFAHESTAIHINCDIFHACTTDTLFFPQYACTLTAIDALDDTISVLIFGMDTVALNTLDRKFDIPYPPFPPTFDPEKDKTVLIDNFGPTDVRLIVDVKQLTEGQVHAHKIKVLGNDTVSLIANFPSSLVGFIQKGNCCWNLINNGTIKLTPGNYLIRLWRETYMHNINIDAALLGCDSMIPFPQVNEDIPLDNTNAR